MTLVALGLDAGSTTAKLVGVDAEGALAWHLLEPMDPHMEAQAERMLAEAAAQTGTDLASVPLVATGYGRDLISRAGRKVTEITCHGKGVFAALGHGGTLVDIGGQDSKVIVIGPKGRVLDFAMNDKCAAGTGRFLEVAAGRLRMELPDFARMAVDAHDEEPISNTCTVFAESEIVGLIARGRPLPGIARGLHRSLVRRIAALARSALLRPPVMLSGGGAKSPALRALLSEELGHDISVPVHPQLMGAYGAALIARG
jgi:(R)-2-hydroxyacyl-CoA dehydratese activating ATPase